MDRRVIGFRLVLKKAARHYWNDTVRAIFNETGDTLVADVKSAIQRQVYDWPALSPRYSQWKDEVGLDERMLIATGYYISKIQSYEIPFGIEVTVPKNEIHPDVAEDGSIEEGHLTYLQLARIHEYGTFDADGFVLIPARPHWRPTILNFRNNKLQRFKKKINNAVVKQMRVELKKHLARHMKQRRRYA